MDEIDEGDVDVVQAGAVAHSLASIDYQLSSIENQLFALNEWLVRYGRRLEPAVESPGIHLVRFGRELTEAALAHGQELAAGWDAAQRAGAVNMLMHCEPMFREVICDVVPAEGSGWIIEVDGTDAGIGYMRQESDGWARQMVGATVGRVRLSPADHRTWWIWLRRFYDGKVFNCKLVVAEEEEPAGGRLGGEEEGEG